MTLILIRPANKEPGRRYKDKPVPGISTMDHNGNDYGWGSGRQVYAAAAGRVSVVRWSSSRATNNRSGGYGNYIIIDHGDGYSTLYAHLPNTQPFVAVGDLVAAREQIGLMGNTGNASGVHLHFEVRLHGQIIDPNPLIGAINSASIDASPIPEEDDMYDDAARDELIGARIDRLMVPMLQKIEAAIGGLSREFATVARTNAVNSTIRREGRARLYQNAETGHIVAAKVTSGFWYPLNTDPELVKGQIASLRMTHYLLIAADEVVEVLPAEQFDNLKEMADGHLRRIAELNA